MAFSAIRKAPLAVMLMLGCAPAHAGWFSSDPAPKVESKPAVQQPANNLEDSIRQAQMLRLAAQYPEAIKHLSQLMMLASDDGRVVSEYGKTLASMGRASDAVNFLTRAQQLLPNDWSNYSAIGVAYDQIGDQKNAQAAYEQALKLNPEEPSVLSNYALSRMLAKDPQNALKLAARAESANSTADPKLARNIAMIRAMAPEQTPVAANAAPVASVSNTAVQAAAAPASNGTVVMQPVPVDPQAGPVQKPAAPVSVAKTAPAGAPTVAAKATAAPASVAAATPTAPTVVKAAEAKPSAPVAPVATGAPRSLQPVAETAKPSVPSVTSLPLPPVKAAETAKTAPAATAVAPVKAAEAKPAPDKPATPVVAKIVAPAKTVEAKPATEVFKIAPGTAPVPVKPPAAAKTAEAPSASVSLTLSPAMTAVKPDANRTASAPKVLPTTGGTKSAEAKPKTKETIPGLRMSANAY